MKSHIRQLLFFVLTVIFFSSCCHKKDCIGDVSDINEITLSNFAYNEVDSIAIMTYKQGTNLTSRVDSFFTNAHGRTGGNNPPLIIFLPQKLDITLDYKIVFISINRTYTLTGFSTKKKVCNACIFGNDDYIVLDNYYVNSQKQSGEFLQISK
ncbi:MAG: hypothetical protein ABR968_14350 [Bacteroidales bacterium]|jgi:hypothetical protein